MNLIVNSSDNRKLWTATGIYGVIYLLPTFEARRFSTPSVSAGRVDDPTSYSAEYSSEESSQIIANY